MAVTIIVTTISIPKIIFCMLSEVVFFVIQLIKFCLKILANIFLKQQAFNCHNVSLQEVKIIDPTAVLTV